MRRIAFMDFDGTITEKDSFLEFIKYAKGETAFYTGFLLNSPILVAFKLKLISNQRAKERILKHFFGKMNSGDFEKLCRKFSKEKLPSLIRPKAAKEIGKLKAAGVEIVIVSASAEDWVKYYCEEIGAKWIASKLQFVNDCFSGKLEGRNCYGAEKTRRIKELYNLSDYQEIYCYGDSRGDLPMLALGTAAFYKPFR